MIYRIKQFLMAVVYSFKEIDEEYIKTYLNENEIKIFNKLSKIDKQHSIRVSKDALDLLEISIDRDEEYELNKNELAKVALLHDIGKIERPLNLIEKSILVLLDKITNGKIKKYTNIKIIDIYYNHGQKGAAILNKSKYSKEFIEVLRKHHVELKTDNKLLKIVKEADKRN